MPLTKRRSARHGAYLTNSCEHFAVSSLYNGHCWDLVGTGVSVKVGCPQGECWLNWMRLSRMWRNMQIEEDVIQRGWRPRWMTSSKICVILHILRKPNPKIVLLLIQNISKFWTRLPPRRLSSNLWPISRDGFKSRCFFLQLLKK